MKIISYWAIAMFSACLTIVANAASIPGVSYQTINLNDASISISDATGSSSLSKVRVNTPAASYYSKYQTWWITETTTPAIEISFSASAPTMVQLTMRVAYVINSGQSAKSSVLNVAVNGHVLTSETQTIKSDQWHQVGVQLPIDKVVKGANKITLSLANPSAPLFVQSVKLMPRNIYSENKVLSTTLYAQFGSTTHVTGATQTEIWTRGYGLTDTMEMIPGPTLFYNAGDLLNVNLVNKMNNKVLEDKKKRLTELGKFEQAEAGNLLNNNDEALANVNDHVRQEVNIPHNLNNTNLHVHGLHVDPEKDDVTIVIVPDSEANTVGQYDAPSQLPSTPEDLVCTLDEGSVADQPVKPGDWLYQYRLPKNHLPGTHWFHPHKHGSTAAQVENGMAGSMVIQEPKQQAIFPKFYDTAWAQEYDRVMMIQQIANYGLQQGKGGQKQTTGPKNNFTPDTVINGIHQNTHHLAPGQIVRWRFVNAGANHQAFNHMWLGENTGRTINTTDAKGNKKEFSVYKSAPMFAIAFDGITTDQKVEVSAARPLLLAPGNRTDVLIQVPSNAPNEKEYTLFKYYPKAMVVVDATFDLDGATQQQIKDHLRWDCTTGTCTHGKLAEPLHPAFQPVTNPYLFATNNNNPLYKGNYSENFAGFQKPWKNTKNKPPQGNLFDVAPLIKLVNDPATPGKLKIDFALSQEFPDVADCTENRGNRCSKGAGQWVPPLDGFGGGAFTAEKLLTIKVDTSKNVIGPTDLPSDKHLNSISVIGSFNKGGEAKGFNDEIPAYVSPFNNSDVLQSRPVIFDKSGVAIQVASPTDATQKAKVNQFTLNGRPFALNDMIGNSTETVNELLSDPVSFDELKRVNTPHSDSISAKDSRQCTETAETSCLDIAEDLSFEASGGSGVWSNGVCRSGDCRNTNGYDYYWANPGYFQPLTYDSNNKVFSYDNSEGNIPTWKAMSGLDTTAIVNPDFRPDDYQQDILGQSGIVHGNVNDIPGLPVATTAEEWVFINNSDIGHPFHIHINPFFVMEVGQLSYEQFSDGAEWVMRAVSYDNSLPNLANPPGLPIDQKPLKPTSPGVYATTNAVPHFVGNWWDTVIVPPHGYVRMRYWMNVPDQTGKDDKAVLEDNANKIGVWVYHCHILRHEDRGMMMPVITQQLSNTPPGPIQCPAGFSKGGKGMHH